MNSVLSIFKRPAPMKDRPFRKSDESMTGVYVAQKHYSANIPQEINLAAFQRCFSQFDRKTDCYRKGVADLAGTQQQCDQTKALFTIAVCGTQTRHGVSVNKYQADSQNYASYSGKQLVRLARKLWIAILARNGGSIPSAGLHWQKTGIGMAADKSSPIREPTRKRKSVPGIGYRQGKSFSYACNE